MKTLDEIKAMWKIDSVMDESTPHLELLKIPILHEKYQSLLSEYKIKLKSVENDYNLNRRYKYFAFINGMGEDEYEFAKQHKWEYIPHIKYNIKATKEGKDSLNLELDADLDLIKILNKKVYIEEIVSYLDSVLKQINSRTFQIQNVIKYLIFLGGLN